MDYFSLYKAWRSCRRRKRATSQAQLYEAYLLDNLIGTVQALRSGQWRPRRPVCFMVDKPKAREIHAAHYSDRVVHHWLVPRLEELYEPIFIHDIYSNRKDKGTHMAVKRLQHFMRSVSRTGGLGDREDTLRHEEETGCRIPQADFLWGTSGMRSHAAHGNKSSAAGYFLQLDIKNFFNSVDRRILFSLLQKRLRKAVNQGKLDEDTAVSYRDISHIILKQDVGQEAFMAATPVELARIPPYKRLVNAGKDKGLPIGNLTSQFFANVYLNELDQFIKHVLKCHHYLRYVDDCVPRRHARVRSTQCSYAA
ncbi:MAG: RNA-directed DNA polymerase [Desulfocapsaceae bacterium]|nr:RNA-directed DNA polymerase [Desulfocapsaceae bacterium]